MFESMRGKKDIISPKLKVDIWINQQTFSIIFRFNSILSSNLRNLRRWPDSSTFDLHLQILILFYVVFNFLRGQYFIETFSWEQQKRTCLSKFLKVLLKPPNRSKIAIFTKLHSGLWSAKIVKKNA